MQQSNGLALSRGKKLMFFTSGSRGDIQPMIALASAMQRAGFRVCVATNVNHVSFVQKFELEAVPIGCDSEHLLQTDPVVRQAMAKGDVVKCMEHLRNVNKKNFPDNMTKKLQAVRTFSPHVILCSILEMYEVFPIAGALKIPVIPAWLQSLFPSKNQQTMLGEPSWCPHRIFGYLIIRLFFSQEKDTKCSVILDQLPEAKPWISLTFDQFMTVHHHPITPVLVGYSPRLYNPKSDWTEELADAVNFTGFWVVNKDEQTARLKAGDNSFGGGSMRELSTFLQKGPPVYMGWGSMLAVSQEHMACLAVRALMKAQLRGIILGGWAELDAAKLKGQADSDRLEAYAKYNVLFVKTAPHEWLFPQCSVTVHHGGSGTTAAALRAGVPTVITPCAFDQFDNAHLVASKGVGIAMRQFSKVTPAGLAAALTQCVSDQGMQERCNVLGRQLQTEDGPGNAVKIVDHFIQNELDTGKWKTRFELFTQELKSKQEQKPPGCLSWIARLLCSLEPNRFLPRMDWSKETTIDTKCISSKSLREDPHCVLLGSVGRPYGEGKLKVGTTAA